MATFVIRGEDDGYVGVCVMRRDSPYLPGIEVTCEGGTKEEIPLPGSGYGHWGAIAEETPDRPVSWEATGINAEGMRLRPVAGGATGRRRWVLMTFDVSPIGDRKVTEAVLRLRCGGVAQRFGPAGKGVKVAPVEGRDAWVAHGAATWRTRDGLRPWTGGRVDAAARGTELDASFREGPPA